MVLLVLSACGSSSVEIKAAKTATYSTSPEEMLDLAIAVAKAKSYDVEVDRTHLAFAAHYHHATNSSHILDQEKSESDATIEGSLGWALMVKIVSAGNHVAVTVVPKSWEERLYAPPLEFAPDDPNMPGFVIDRASELSVAIYERAKPYVTQDTR